MSRPWRLTIFLSFLLMFLISAPLVVLYTAGYRFDLTTGRIVHTGVLNVTSIPRSATVFIAGEQQSNRTPSVFDNVYPGEQLIRLEKEGFTSWEKQIDVESRETAFVVDAILFFEDELTIEDDRKVQLAQLSHDRTQLAYLVREGSWVELWLTNGFAQAQRLLARLPDSIGADYLIEWSADNTYLSLRTQKTFTLVSALDGSNPVISTLVDQASDIWWDAADDGLLYTQVGTSVYRAFVGTRETELLPFRAVAVMYPGEDIALSETSDRMFLSRYEGETASIITYLPIGEYRFRAAPDGVALLEDTQRGRIVLVDLQGQDQPILLNEEASTWQWNADQDRLAFTDGFDLEVYTRSSHSTQTLTRQSEQIGHLMWYPLGSALLYLSGETLTSIELDSRDGHEISELAHGVLSTFWTDEDGDDLFVLGTVDDQTGIFSRKLQR